MTKKSQFCSLPFASETANKLNRMNTSIMLILPSNCNPFPARAMKYIATL